MLRKCQQRKRQRRLSILSAKTRSAPSMLQDRARVNGREVTITRFGLSIFLLLLAQCFDRMEASGKVGGDERGERANEKRADANDPDILRHNLRGDLGELVNFAWKNLDVQCRGEPMAEF